jgi:hypothetical protein
MVLIRRFGSLRSGKEGSKQNTWMFVGGKQWSFIIGKGEGITGGDLCRWNEGAVCRGKKREEFLFEVVYISSLTWRWEENLYHSLSPMALGSGGGSGWTHAYLC